MSAKKKTGLGRGFDSLIPAHIVEDEFDPTAGKSTGDIRHVLIQDIKPNPHQPRKNFDDQQLNELVESIKVHGILQPLIVTDQNGMYQLIAGERRWRAAQKLAHEKVPVIVRSVDDQAKLEIALIENLQRAELNILETATALFKLIDQFNLSSEEVGKRVGRSVSSVSNIVRLLGLPKPAKRALADGKISEGHARQILAVKDPKKQQELLDYIIKFGWSVRQAEQFVKKFKQDNVDSKEAMKRVAVRNDLTKSLSSFINGRDVTLKNMAKGGRLMIHYKDEKDLEEIVKQITKE